MSRLLSSITWLRVQRAVENGVDEQTLADLYDQGLVLLDNQIDSQVENLTLSKQKMKMT